MTTTTPELRVFPVSTVVSDGKTSDGYHTFDELYAHRIVLFKVVLGLMKKREVGMWKSKLHHNGDGYPGWFLVGLETGNGPIRYHLPDSEWESLSFVTEVERAPVWDQCGGHVTIQRLEKLLLTVVHSISWQ